VLAGGDEKQIERISTFDRLKTTKMAGVPVVLNFSSALRAERRNRKRSTHVPYFEACNSYRPGSNTGAQFIPLFIHK
jgi:hypothetical protein